MTKVIKINCDKIWSIIGIGIWISITSIFIFGIYVQEVTLTTFTNNGSCHTNFFTGEHKCYSDFVGTTTQFLTIVDVKSIELFFIGLTIATQISGVLILNQSRKWIAFECKSKESS